MATAAEVIAKCVEHDHNSTFHDTAVCAIADLRRAGFALVRVPEIPHKGPHDTDGTLLDHRPAPLRLTQQREYPSTLIPTAVLTPTRKEHSQ